MLFKGEEVGVPTKREEVAYVCQRGGGDLIKRGWGGGGGGNVVYPNHNGGGSL